MGTTYIEWGEAPQPIRCQAPPMVATLSASAASPAELATAEAVLEGLSDAALALERLEELTVAPPGAFGAPGAWCARIERAGEVLLAKAEGAAWGLYAPTGVSADESMSFARRLHALLGAPAQDWDADR
jgi:hypothetical protein